MYTDENVTKPKRRRRRPEERPQELIDAALEVFGERGYAAATLDDIARVAGGTKGAIYHHFKGKEDLLRKAIDSLRQPIREKLREGLPDDSTPNAIQLRVVLRRHWDYWTSPGWATIHQLLMGEIRRELPDLFESWIAEGPVLSWELLERILHRGQESGEFRRDLDVPVAARAIVAALSTQVTFFNVMPDSSPPDPDRVFEATLDLVLRGTLHGPSTS